MAIALIFKTCYSAGSYIRKTGMAKRKSPWFRPVRGSYLPASPAGLVIYLAYAAYVVLVAAGWYVDGHRIWYLLVDVIPLTAAAALLTQFIASRHSK